MKNRKRLVSVPRRRHGGGTAADASDEHSAHLCRCGVLRRDPQADHCPAAGAQGGTEPDRGREEAVQGERKRNCGSDREKECDRSGNSASEHPDHQHQRTDLRL